MSEPLSAPQCSAPPSASEKIFSSRSGLLTAAAWSFSACQSGIWRSFSPCTTRNGQVMLAAAFSSVICRVTAKVSSWFLVPNTHWPCSAKPGTEGSPLPPPRAAPDAGREGDPEIEDRAPGDAALEALLERRRARRIVAAERERHDADAVAVDVGARLQVVDGRRRRLLGVG